MLQDEVLYKIADRVKNFAVIYLCDIDEVCFSFSIFVRALF
jgi:DIM1 family U5 snRNP protein